MSQLVGPSGGLVVGAGGGRRVGAAGDPCCCDSPAGACACTAVPVRGECGLPEAGTVCCKVPPDFDLVIEGAHRYQNSITGSIFQGTGVVCTAPGMTRREVISYTLKVKARCVNGVVVRDYAGSVFRLEMGRYRYDANGVGAYVDDPPVEVFGEEAWARYAVRNRSGWVANASGFALGVMPWPRTLDMFGFARAENNPGTLCSGVGNRQVTEGWSCPHTQAAGWAHQYTWEAARTCSAGSLRADGTGYARMEAIGIGAGGATEERAEFSDQVTWARDEHVGVPIVDCAGVDCGPGAAEGACCLRVGGLGPLVRNNCIVTTRERCRLINGTYGGDRRTCAQAGCELLGGCCLPDGTCFNTYKSLCRLRMGVWLGGGVSCGLVACGGLGACCVGGIVGCVQTTGAACAGVGGLFKGVGTLCATAGCVVTPEEVGACCVVGADGGVVCFEGVTAGVCAGKGGSWRRGVVCSAAGCGVVAPVGPGEIGVGVGPGGGGAGALVGVEWML